MTLTFAPDDLEFDVDKWREITKAARIHLNDDYMFNVSEDAMRELLDIGRTIIHNYDERSQ